MSVDSQLTMKERHPVNAHAWWHETSGEGGHGACGGVGVVMNCQLGR